MRESHDNRRRGRMAWTVILLGAVVSQVSSCSSSDSQASKDGLLRPLTPFFIAEYSGAVFVDVPSDRCGTDQVCQSSLNISLESNNKTSLTFSGGDDISLTGCPRSPDFLCRAESEGDITEASLSFDDSDAAGTIRRLVRNADGSTTVTFQATGHWVEVP